MVKMRYDMFICFFISCLLLVAINAAGSHYIDMRTEQSEQEKEISAEEIGGKADDTIPIVKSVAEMREQSRFTLQFDEDEDDYSIFYAEDQIWNVLELESGETIVADIYRPSTQYIDDEDDYWSYTELLPVGTLVEKSLSQEMIDEIHEEGFEVSVTDCYIDMANGNNKKYDPQAAQVVMYTLMCVVPIAAFILLHILGVNIGIFPPIINRRSDEQA